jgi:hypothetical protein
MLCHSGARVSANPESRANNFGIPGLSPQVGNRRPKAHPGMTTSEIGRDEELTFP